MLFPIDTEHGYTVSFGSRTTRTDACFISSTGDGRIGRAYKRTRLRLTERQEQMCKHVPVFLHLLDLSPS